MITRFLTLLLICLTGAGCSIYSRPEHPRPATKLSKEVLSYFAYTQDEELPTLGEIEDQGAYWTRTVTFPARPGEAGGEPAKAIEYLPKPMGAVPRPAVVVMPILGGSYGISRYLAEYIAARGYACLRFLRPGKLLDRQLGLEYSLAMYCRAIIDVRRGLDWWENQDGVDATRLGIVGISQGGILGAATMGVEPRLRSGVFLLAGGGIPELIVESEEPSVVRFRNTLMAREGWSLERLADEAEQLIGPVDVTDLAAAIETERVFMIHGRYDRSILPKHGDALWRALGKPDRIVFPFGHYSSILLLPWAAAFTVDHLDYTLRR
ncbi:MAG: prolyl oligopeptidase family serine peptidase [Planctomycetota bacterium]